MENESTVLIAGVAIIALLLVNNNNTAVKPAPLPPPTGSSAYAPNVAP
jgi:hypothetical protein